MELALAKSAIMTDFASGEEWQQLKKEFHEIRDQALHIFESRVENQTLNKFRRDECWIEGDEYSSPVPHTERLGPVDYLACLQMLGGEEPTLDTVRSLQMGINFAKAFQARSCVITLESGGGLQGGVPGYLLAQVEALLKDHLSVVQGKKSFEEVMIGSKTDSRTELRHCGTLTGEMKDTHKKLAKDIEKLGLRRCNNEHCEKAESHPKQFQKCSRCEWAAYCSRECQKCESCQIITSLCLQF